MAKTKPTPEPVTTKAVAPFNDRLAALAKAGAKREESSLGGTSMITTKGGRLAFGGNAFPDNKLQCVVVDYLAENAFYDGARYDPDNPTSPVCFSFFREEADAAPHEKSESPQCDTCATCPHNQFGSADTGKGKACKNIRRLGVILEDGMEDIENASIVGLKLPPTSLKGWASYVNRLNSAYELPPLAFITEISLVPDAKTQFRLEFNMVEQIEDQEILEALLNRNESTEAILTVPYQPNGERPAPAPAARGRGPLPGAKTPPATSGAGARQALARGRR